MGINLRFKRDLVEFRVGLGWFGVGLGLGKDLPSGCLVAVLGWVWGVLVGLGWFRDT